MTSRIGAVARSAGCVLLGRPFVGNLNVDTTNVCNQRCPMCNALREDDRSGEFLTVAQFERYLSAFDGVPVLSCSLSGGEPTLAPEIEGLIALAARRFPFGFNLNTNLYGSWERIRPAVAAALRHHGRLDVSFDGFGEVADRQRGVTRVAERVEENLRRLAKLRLETGSRSMVTIHTVISDDNLDQVEDIFRMSRELGFLQTIAPIHPPLDVKRGRTQSTRLSPSPRLKQVLAFALSQPHLNQSRSFVSGIEAFAADRYRKLCPYLSWPMTTYKVFLLFNGDIHLCDRIPFGNVAGARFADLLKSSAYSQTVARVLACRGCWYICYVEPTLRARPLRRLAV